MNPTSSNAPANEGVGTVYQMNATTSRQLMTSLNVVHSSVPIVSNKSNNREDIESIKGRFGWKAIGIYNVPYLIRIIGNKPVQFVSVRIAESELLKDYLNNLHPDIFKCTAIDAYLITEPEAKLLTDLNRNHAQLMYGQDDFSSGADYVVRIEDVQELYGFIKACHDRLKCDVTPGRDEIFGFLNIDHIVPYFVKDGLKYLPVIFFENYKKENLRRISVTLDNWCWAYVKFCCIAMKMYVDDSHAVVSLEDLKKFYPPGKTFEDYWPRRLGERYLISSNNSHAWFRSPLSAPKSTAVAPEGILSGPLLLPSSPLPAPTPMPSNPLPVAASGPAGIAPPPTIMLPNVQLGLQQIHGMPKSFEVGSLASVSSSMTHSIQSIQSWSSQPSVQQQQNVSRISGPVEAGPSSDIIDLLSPPSSPTPQEMTEPLHVELQIQTMPERSREHNVPNTDAFKIYEINIEGKQLYGIYAYPFGSSELQLFVQLDEFVQTLIHDSYNIWKCAVILSTKLNITLYKRNSKKFALWQIFNQSRGLKVTNECSLLMIMLTDIIQVMPKLRDMVKEDLSLHHCQPRISMKRKYPL